MSGTPSGFPKFLRRIALPSLGIFLISFGWGGKKWPTVNAMIGYIDSWLTSNADYPWLAVAGLVVLAMWGGYQLFQWYFETRKEQWRGRLINLLQDGVALRNEGQAQIATQSAAVAWISKVKNWDERVCREIARLDKNEAEDYSLLDVSPQPRLAIDTPIKDHSWHYQHHDYRLVKLRDLVRAKRPV